MLKKELKENFEKEFGVTTSLVSYQNLEDDCGNETVLIYDDFNIYLIGEEVKVSNVFINLPNNEKAKKIIDSIKLNNQYKDMERKISEQESVIDDFSKEIARLQTIIDKSFATKSALGFAQETILKAIKGEN